MIIATAQDAATLLAPFFAGREEEELAVIHLDRRQRLIALTLEDPGRPGEVELPARAILATALKLGASAIIISHNHPSGDPAPSRADRDTTRLVAEAAAGVGVRLHDHLIFAGDQCRSFRALGLL